MRPGSAFRALGWLAPLGLLVAAALAGPWVWPEVLPRSWSTRSFAVFGRQAGTLASSLGVSLAVALGATLVSLGACLPAARHLARHPRPAIEGLLLLPALMPPLAYLWGLQGLFAGVGLADTPVAVVLGLAAVTFPYVLRALLEGYRLFPAGLVTVALNLGASPRRTFWTVEVPLLVPSLVLGCTLAFLAAWSDWLVAFLVGGGVVGTYPLFLYPFLLSSDRAVGSLGVLVFLAVPLGLWAASDRWTAARSRRLGLARGRGGWRV